MRTFRRRPLVAFFLALLVLVTGIAAVCAHHDHDLTAHHGDCPTCRLADETAGALPVLAAASGAILPATPATFAAPDLAPAPVRVQVANPLRAPPIA